MVASETARIGPTMKQISSATASKEYAVCSFGGSSRYRCAQRARTIEPVLGITPMPAANRNSVQSGRPVRAPSSRPAAASTVASVAGSATRRWPCRSTSREIHGPSTAAETARVADSALPSQKVPFISASMVTVPIPVIEIGRRAISPEDEKARLPGAAKIWR